MAYSVNPTRCPSPSACRKVFNAPLFAVDKTYWQCDGEPSHCLFDSTTNVIHDIAIVLVLAQSSGARPSQSAIDGSAPWDNNRPTIASLT